MYNVYWFRLDNGDSKPWPWETPRERTILSQRLDSLEYDQALIVKHKRNFQYTGARPNPCIQVHTRPYVLCSAPPVSIGSPLHSHLVINERLIQNVLHNSQCESTRQDR
jgi:hypothetical protein